MKTQVDWKKVAVGYSLLISFTAFVDSGIGVFLMVCTTLGLLGFISKKEDPEFQEVFDSTDVVKDPNELWEKGYRHLQNVLAEVTSLRDPRAGQVILDYQSQGYDVKLCPQAGDNRGRLIADSNIYSLWGRKPIATN